MVGGAATGGAGGRMVSRVRNVGDMLRKVPVMIALMLLLLAVARIATANDMSMRKYMVVDLSGGPAAREYPIEYLDSEPVGGWTDEHKTVKLVLRLVKPGKFIMRGAWVKGVREVELSHPYYIGVFEVTQAQYKLIMGMSSNVLTEEDMRPMNCLSWYALRAGPDASDKLKDVVVWPVSVRIGEDSFVGKMRTKTHLKGFDLPTEAQWEYALNGAKSASPSESLVEASEMLKYGRFLNNGGWPNELCVVGSYLPNALGLYDMHGNVREWCLDFLGDLAPGKFVDPHGAATNRNDKRVLRGESCCTNITEHKNPYRSGYYANCGGSDMGFRIVCNMIRQEGGSSCKDAKNEK